VGDASWALAGAVVLVLAAVWIWRWRRDTHVAGRPNLGDQPDERPRGPVA
jgi:hypothetical protein